MMQECREKSKLTLKQLSRLLNISVHTYWAMEQGKILFRTEIIEMLSKIYQVRLFDSNLNQDAVLEIVEMNFASLDEKERFFHAMENLTGEGSYKSSYRKVENVKNDILLKLNQQQKSAH